MHKVKESEGKYIECGQLINRPSSILVIINQGKKEYHILAYIVAVSISFGRMNLLKPTLDDRTKGMILTLLTSFIILFGFFSAILSNPNNYYFNVTGDGMQTYFHALYHTKYDSTLLRQQSVNYPYGESVFFTGCLPTITNTIKIIKPIFDFSDYTIGIINLLALLSIPCSAAFIFLIFQHWKMNWWYSALIATGIAFFSPQIDRLGGHLALTFQFSIPALIYFLNLFYENPNYKKSFIIGLFVFFISSQHLYFFGFSGLIAFVFFLILFIKNDKQFGSKFSLLFHFAIQIILPYVIIQVLLFLSESAPDRSDFPWGFLVFKANTTSVFYPTRQWYENFAHSFITPIPYEWEGRAYIGLMGLMAVVASVILLIRNLIREKRISITGNVFLDILLVAALVALLYSFGHPFLYFEEYLKYSGPIKQMRGIGRFTWIFFYVINLAGFFLLHQWTKKIKPAVKYIFLLSSVVLLYSEAFPSLKLIQPVITNKVADMEDSGNKLPNNRWMSQLKTSDFQAILPLPYFHIGSENLTIGFHSDLSNYTYITSLKTGLPLYAVSASRTSLSETYHNISILKSNTSLPELPPLIPGKALLIICKKEALDEDEKLLYNEGTFLYQAGTYEILKIYPEAIPPLYEKRKRKIQDELTTNNSILTNPKLFILQNFDSLLNTQTFKGTGALEFGVEENKVIYHSILPPADTSKMFTFSFWLNDFKKDLYPRSYIEYILFDSIGNEHYRWSTNPSWKYKQFHQDWALIEFEFKAMTNNDRLKVSIYNKELLPEKRFIIDEIMIKPYYQNVYQQDSIYISKNNRYYLISEKKGNQ